MWTPGTECRLRVDSWDPETPPPVDGDLLYTDAGAAYRIVEFRPARPGSRSLGTLVCVRLQRGSVTPAGGGYRWHWTPR